MPRTADHVLFGRADLAGDATDAAHRPPMVERDGPRPHRGGSPLRPTSVAGFLHPLGTRPWEPTPQRDPPPPLSLSPPPPGSHPPAETPKHPGPPYRQKKHFRRRGSAQKNRGEF